MSSNVYLLQHGRILSMTGDYDIHGDQSQVEHNVLRTTCSLGQPHSHQALCASWATSRGIKELSLGSPFHLILARTLSSPHLSELLNLL